MQSDYEKYHYRREHHLCTKCGAPLTAEDKLTTCNCCAALRRTKSRQRYANWSAERKRVVRVYREQWVNNNPDKPSVRRLKAGVYWDRWSKRQKEVTKDVCGADK